MPAGRTLAVLGALALIAVGMAVFLPSSPGPASATGIVEVAAGGGHSCALTTSGGVQCWGANDFGQLGDGSITRSSVPVNVVGLDSGVVAISAGANHTCAITSEQDVKCWGGNDAGQLGTGTTTDAIVPLDVCSSMNVCFLNLTNVIQISTGSQFTCALLESGPLEGRGGKAWCWGSNNRGQLGNGHTSPDGRAYPGPVCADQACANPLAGVAHISAGNSAACAAMATGAAKCWGWNASGQLGNHSLTDSSTPVDVCQAGEFLCPPVSGFSTVDVGRRHACALTTTGQVRCWGLDVDGQLGAPTIEDCPGACATTPRAVCANAACDSLLSGITEVEVGDSHTCARPEVGGLKCWGWNGWGSVGDGTDVDRDTPVDVIDLPAAVAQISAGFGDGHTCIATVTDEVLCWGRNQGGGVGDGTTQMRLAPVGVIGLSPKLSATQTPLPETPTPTQTPLPETPTPTQTASEPNTPTPTQTASEPNTPTPIATSIEPTATPSPSTAAGDVDCSGAVDAIDAALILQFVAGLLDSLPCPTAADASADGDVNSIDAALILQLSAGLLAMLPP